MLTDLTIEEFLEITCAGEDEGAGGGSVAALAGAVAAALAVLVANLTLGRKKFADVEDEMLAIRDRGKELCMVLTRLMDEDIEAFTPVMNALRLPKETDAEREERKTRLQEALAEAARVPLKTAELSLEVLDLASRAVHHGNSSAATDAGVAVMMALAGVEGAALNVNVNLALVEDAVIVEELTRRQEKAVEQARVRAHEALEQVVKLISK